jgi:pyruvate formate lyase activating enzyme
MIFESIRPLSMIDFPGKGGPVFFAKGCNYRCGYCYNTSNEFVDKETLERTMREVETKAREGWYTGAPICGGEPTLQYDLPEFVKRLKDMGLAVKLDTNGKNYPAIGELIQEGLVDYIAMDVKGPFGLYRTITGMEHVDFRDEFLKGLAVVGAFPNHEFRTTVCPIVRESGEITFMTPEEIGEAAEEMYNNLPNNDHKYFLQSFVPVKDRLIDKRLENAGETPREILEEGCELAKKYLPNTKIRAR